MRLPDRPSAGSDVDADALAARLDADALEARLDAYAVPARDLNADGEDARLARPADRGRHHALADRLARLPAAHPSAGLAAEHEGALYGDQTRLRAERADLRYGQPDDSWGRRDDGGDRADDLAQGDLARGDLGDDELGLDELDQDVQWRDAGQGEPDQGQLDQGEPDQGEPDQGELGQGDSGALPRTARHAGDTSAWAELGGQLAPRSPYRPWFGADGVADPWFAPDLDE